MKLKILNENGDTLLEKEDISSDEAIKILKDNYIIKTEEENLNFNQVDSLSVELGAIIDGRVTLIGDIRLNRDSYIKDVTLKYVALANSSVVIDSTIMNSELKIIGKNTTIVSSRLFNSSILSDSSIVSSTIENSSIGKNVKIAKNNSLFNVLINNNITIGSNNKLLINKIYNGVSIGNNCNFDSDVVLLDNVIISDNVTLEEEVYIGTNSSIGTNNTIKYGTLIMDNVMSYDNVTIGKNCIIYSYVTLNKNIKLASSVTVLHKQTVEKNIGEYKELKPIYERFNNDLDNDIDISDIVKAEMLLLHNFLDLVLRRLYNINTKNYDITIVNEYNLEEFIKSLKINVDVFNIIKENVYPIYIDVILSRLNTLKSKYLNNEVTEIEVEELYNKALDLSSLVNGIEDELTTDYNKDFRIGIYNNSLHKVILSCMFKTIETNYNIDYKKEDFYPLLKLTNNFNLILKFMHNLFYPIELIPIYDLCFNSLTIKLNRYIPNNKSELDINHNLIRYLLELFGNFDDVYLNKLNKEELIEYIDNTIDKKYSEIVKKYLTCDGIKYINTLLKDYDLGNKFLCSEESEKIKKNKS